MKAGAMVALLVAAMVALAVVPSAHAGRDLLGDSSSDKGKKVSIAGADADVHASGRRTNTGTDNTVVTKPGLAYSESGSTADSAGVFYYTVAKGDGKAIAKGDFAKTHTDTYVHAIPHGALSSLKSSAVSVNGRKRQGKTVSIAGADTYAHAYGRDTYASSDNTVVTKPGLAYSESNSTAGSAGYYSYEAKADGKAVAKGDFAKTHTDTYTNVGLFYPKSSSKSSAVSVSG